jgi:hypothetical protein
VNYQRYGSFEKDKEDTRQEKPSII